MATCRSCDAEIVWVVVSATNRRMPLDPDPVMVGNVVRLEGDQARVLTSAELAQRMAQPGGPGLLYKSHFATCPNAAAHRTRQGQ